MKNKFLLMLLLALLMTAAGKETVWADTLTMTIERFSLGGGFIMEPTTVEFSKGDSYADVLDRVASQKNLQYRSSVSQYGFYLEGISGVDCTPNIPACVQRVMSAMNQTLGENNTDGLYEFSYTGQSGWLFSVNNIFPERGMEYTYPSDGDAARLMFSLAGFGADLRGASRNTAYTDQNGNFVEIAAQSFYDTADKSELIRLMGEANADRRKWESVDGFSQAYAEAVNVMAQMDATENDVNEAVDLLKEIRADVYPTPTKVPSTPTTTPTPAPGTTTTPTDPGTTTTPTDPGTTTTPTDPGTTTTPVDPGTTTTPTNPTESVSPTPETPQESTTPTPEPSAAPITPTPEPTGEPPTTTVIENPDGTKTEITESTVTNEDGTTIQITETENKDASGALTGSSIKAEISTDSQGNGASATVSVSKDGNGKVTNAKADVTNATASSAQKALLSADMVKQITEVAGSDSVKITIQNGTGSNANTIEVNAADITAGKKLYIVAQKADGSSVLVNAKTYTVTKDGDLFATVKGAGAYKLITASQADTLSKKILQTVKAKNAKKVIKKSKTAKMALKNTLNMENVKSVQYSVSKSIASVTKKGIIKAKKAGTAVVKAKVTLKNGKAKTVKMKITIKK